MGGKVRTPEIIGVTPNEGKVDCGEAGFFARISCGFRDKSPEILLDFGKKRTGYTKITFGATSGDTLVLRYGPVADCLHLCQKIPMKSDSCDLGEFYLAARYVAVSVESTSIQTNPVFCEIRSFCLIDSQYPVEYVGQFSAAEDPALETVFRRGARTVELCMQKYRESCRFRMQPFDEKIGKFSANWKGRYGDYVLLDGPRRDREAWIGDIRVEALTAYTVFRSPDVCKNSIALFAELMRNDGTTVGSGSTWQNFIEYNYWFIISVWECYLYTGDRLFLESMLPAVRNILDFSESRLDENGFIANDASWMWTVPREGENAGTQAIFSFALENAAKIEEALHFSARAKRCRSLQSKIKESINRVFWNEEKGVYEEKLRIRAERIPVLLDVNCYAVIFGIADEKKSARILDYLKKNMWTEYGSCTMSEKIVGARLEEGISCYPLIRAVQEAKDPEDRLFRFMWGHNRTVWPFINGYETEARFLAGDVDGALELIHRCWDHDYFDETDSYWEMVHPENPVFHCGTMYDIPKDDCYNSAAHGWSGWVSHLLQKYVLGVSPAEPGFASLTVAPLTGKLNQVRGCVPVPRGDVTVSVKKTEKQYFLTVEKPAGVEVRTDLSPRELGGRVPVITVTEV